MLFYLFIYLIFFKTMSNLKPSILHPALKSNSVVTLYLIPQKQSSISESKLMATLPLPKLYGKVYKTLSTFATILKLCLGKRFLKEITPLKSLSNWILKNKIKKHLKNKTNIRYLFNDPMKLPKIYNLPDYNTFSRILLLKHNSRIIKCFLKKIIIHYNKFIKPIYESYTNYQFSFVSPYSRIRFPCKTYKYISHIDINVPPVILHSIQDQSCH